MGQEYIIAGRIAGHRQEEDERRDHR